MSRCLRLPGADRGNLAATVSGRHVCQVNAHHIRVLPRPRGGCGRCVPAARGPEPSLATGTRDVSMGQKVASGREPRSAHARGLNHGRPRGEFAGRWHTIICWIARCYGEHQRDRKPQAGYTTPNPRPARRDRPIGHKSQIRDRDGGQSEAASLAVADGAARHRPRAAAADGPTAKSWHGSIRNHKHMQPRCHGDMSRDDGDQEYPTNQSSFFTICTIPLT